MKHHTHFKSVSKAPFLAQSTTEIKLAATTEIIDRLLLAQRQAAWKASGPGDADTSDTGTDTGGDTNTGTGDF